MLILKKICLNDYFDSVWILYGYCMDSVWIVHGIVKLIKATHLSLY